MIEFVTVSISQASEGAQFLPEPPLAQQHVSSCSFTPMQLIFPRLRHKASLFPLEIMQQREGR